MTDTEIFKCKACGHEFEHEAGEAVICPKCHTESRSFPMSMIEDEGPRPKSRRRIGKLPMAQNTLLWVGLPVISVFVLMGQLEKCGDSSNPESIEAHSEVENERAGGDAVATMALQLAPEKSVDALTKALHAELNREGVQRGNRLSSVQAPRTPNQLADAFDKGTVGVVFPLELGLLHGDMVRALGHRVTYSLAPSIQHAGSDLMARQLGVSSGGSFYNAWTGVVAPKEEAALSIGEVAAHGDALRALAHLEEANLEDATARIIDALRSRPDDAAMVLIQGQILLAQGKGEAGIEELNRAIQLNEDGHAHFTLGTAHLIEDNLFAAYKAFETATRLDTDFAEAWLALGGVEMRRLEVTPHSTHAAAFERIMAALDKAEQIDPELDGLRTARAQVLLVQGKMEEGNAVLQETVRQFPDRVEPALLLGQLALQQNDLQGAAKALEAAADADPTRGDVRELMGMVCMSTGNWSPCIDSLVAGLERAPEDGIIRLQLASAYRESGQGEKAQVVLTEHVERFPKDATGHLLLAQLYLDRGEAEKALTSVETGMLLSPVTEAFVLEYLALRALGKTTEAMAVVSRFGARDKDAFSLMAQALLEQGRLAEAEDILKGWKSHKPKDPEPSLLLAMVYRASEREPLATALEEELLAAIPVDERPLLESRIEAQKAQVQAMLEGALP